MLVINPDECIDCVYNKYSGRYPLCDLGLCNAIGEKLGVNCKYSPFFGSCIESSSDSVIVCPEELSSDEVKPGDKVVCAVEEKEEVEQAQQTGEIPSDTPIFYIPDSASEVITYKLPGDEEKSIVFEIPEELEPGEEIQGEITGTDSNQQYIGDPCYNGLGTCISISAGTFCEGDIKAGYCGGSSDIMCCVPEKNIDACKMILDAAEELEGLPKTIVPDLDENGLNCFDSILYIHSQAGIPFRGDCIYSDEVGKKYTYEGKEIIMGITKRKSSGKIIFVVNENCDDVGFSEKEKLSLLEPGYLLDIVFDEDDGHSVVFVEWVDKKGNARVFDWGTLSGTGRFGYSTINLRDNQHSVYLIRKP